jgi:hypothetical protein
MTAVRLAGVLVTGSSSLRWRRRRQANTPRQEGMTTMSELDGFCADKLDGNYAHPSDPNKFVSCVAQTNAYERDCPEGYTYDPDTDMCVSPEGGSISPEELTHPNRRR